MIKAVFFDIDGTLIPHKEELFPTSTLMALNKLKESGIKVFIATGRSHTNITNATSQFDFDGYLALNGQYCVVGDQVVRDCYIEDASIQSVIQYFDENNIASIFAEKEYVYVNKYTDQYKNFCTDRKMPFNTIDDTKRTLTHPVYQLMVFINEEEEPELFKHLPHCKSARWHPMFADVIPTHGGKNIGIDAVCNYLNITKEETMAFGDGGNDIDMLQHVGIGVAMGNASDQVKQYADYVTSCDKEDGIYNALKHFNVIE